MIEYNSPAIQLYFPWLYTQIKHFLDFISMSWIYLINDFIYEILFLPIYFISGIFNHISFDKSISIYGDVFLDYRYFLLWILTIFLISILYFIIIYLLWKKFNVIYKNIFKKEIIKKEISSQKANYYLIYCQLIPYLWVILTFIIWLKYKITYIELIKKVSFWLMIKVIIFSIYFITILISLEFHNALYICWEAWEFEIMNEDLFYGISSLNILIIFYLIPFLIFTMSTIYYFLISKKSNN